MSKQPLSPEELLSALMDGQLIGEEKVRAEALLNDERYQDLLDAWQTQAEQIRQLPRFNLPKSFSSQVLKAAKDRRAAESQSVGLDAATSTDQRNENFPSVLHRETQSPGFDIRLAISAIGMLAALLLVTLFVIPNRGNTDSIVRSELAIPEIESKVDAKTADEAPAGALVEAKDRNVENELNDTLENSFADSPADELDADNENADLGQVESGALNFKTGKSGAISGTDVDLQKPGGLDALQEGANAPAESQLGVMEIQQPKALKKQAPTLDSKVASKEESEPGGEALNRIVPERNMRKARPLQAGGADSKKEAMKADPTAAPNPPSQIASNENSDSVPGNNDQDIRLASPQAGRQQLKSFRGALPLTVASKSQAVDQVWWIDLTDSSQLDGVEMAFVRNGIEFKGNDEITQGELPTVTNPNPDPNSIQPLSKKKGITNNKTGFEAVYVRASPQQMRQTMAELSNQSSYLVTAVQIPANPIRELNEQYSFGLDTQPPKNSESVESAGQAGLAQPKSAGQAEAGDDSRFIGDSIAQQVPNKLTVYRGNVKMSKLTKNNKLPADSDLAGENNGAAVLGRGEQDSGGGRGRSDIQSTQRIAQARQRSMPNKSGVPQDKTEEEMKSLPNAALNSKQDADESIEQLLDDAKSKLADNEAKQAMDDISASFWLVDGEIDSDKSIRTYLLLVRIDNWQDEPVLPNIMPAAPGSDANREEASSSEKSKSDK